MTRYFRHMQFSNIMTTHCFLEGTKKLLQGDNIAVSAPTSFGKSFIIDAFIKIKEPKNVMIIVPTIALTDETRRRIHRKFSNQYKIITATDVELSEKNIFIFPQERAINYVNSIESIDLLVIDEFYKASRDFDKERSPNLIKAMIKLGKKAKQRYFLAPNISRLGNNPFTKDMEFMRLEFNTVFLNKHKCYERIKKDEELKKNELITILKEKLTKTLIYAGTYSEISKVSQLLQEYNIGESSSLLSQFSKWLSVNYCSDWDLVKLAFQGTGIHNGKLHRSLSQIQVKLFEEPDGLNNLISTSSIIEGVNTSAENVIIWNNKNGRSKLNDFTYKNIIGRGGRMFKHFIGNIYILALPPENEDINLEIPFPDEILGDLDVHTYSGILTQEQIAKIKQHHSEMSDLLGRGAYQEIRENTIFQNSNSEEIKKIAAEMSYNPSLYNGLRYLNSNNPDHWETWLYKIIRIAPDYFGVEYRIVVSFIKKLRNNWNRTIPELLKELNGQVDIEQFFQFEKYVTYKFVSVLRDINQLQKTILNNRCDISSFINKIMYAFLPPVVFQLEEYGLPRMISRKIHNARLINFENNELDIYIAIEKLTKIGRDNLYRIVDFDPFEKYIIDHFFDGVSNTAINS